MKGECREVSSSPAATRSMSWVLWGALVTGALLRVLYYLGGRSLWIDEARLALNIASRSYAGLLRPLDYDQAAPPLFLWGEKLATQVFGVNELALRILPLVAGIAALILLVPLLRRFLPGWPGVLAVTSACLAPTLVFYSTEVKPYMGDLAICLLLLHGAFAWVERPSSRLARAFPWIGALSVWASVPAAFVLAAAGAANLVTRRTSLRSGLKEIGLPFLVWLLSFGLVFILSYRATSHNEYLRQFWAEGFLSPWDPGDYGRLARLRSAERALLWGLTAGSYNPPPAPSFLPPPLPGLVLNATTVLAVTAFIGILTGIRRWKPWHSILLFGPSMVMLCASAVALYPVALRTSLFVVPALYTALFLGGGRALAVLPRWASWRAAVFCVSSLFALQLFSSVLYTVRPDSWESVGPMAGAFMHRHRPSESIYVDVGALPAWAFYTTDWSRPDRARLARLALLGRSDGVAFENTAARGTRPVGEGRDLRFATRSWTELIGVPAGFQIRPGDPNTIRMDPGWFQNELARIRAEGCGRAVWILTSHSRGPDRLLLSGLEVAGGRATFSMTDDAATLTRYEFGHSMAAFCTGLPPTI